MFNSQSIKVLLGVLVLCGAPAAAQVSLNVVGPELVEGVYVATEGSTIFLGARANPGDAVGILAAPTDKYLQPDYSAAVLLAVDENSVTGAVSSMFEIPKGLAGMSFQIIAAAMNVDGALFFTTATVTVVSQDAGG